MKKRDDRGVALIIVLLVTALLMALIFEFAYGTRISLRAVVNFRNSQRAHYLARSGANFAGMLLSDNLKNGKLQADLEQRNCDLPLPFIPGGDTVLKVCWEDEGSKINIGTVVKGNDAYKRLENLFGLDTVQISQEVLDRISSSPTEQRKFYLLTELHQYLVIDDDFGKVKDFLTVSPVTKIDVNTASVEVLQSIGLSAGMASMVKDRRDREGPFKTLQEVNDFLGPQNTMVAGLLDITSNIFKVNSYATVGGYMRVVEAVITRSTASFTVNYWREL